MTPLSHIRNFSIVAHIDHGKSTLADRLIQETNTVSLRDMKAQMLDSMDIERERGITIKAQTVRINYTAQNGEEYILNLIDTPGHVDFAYEVSRSMRAVEGSLLVVDSTQGVEAQTLANVYHAIDADHEIVPVLNKIDLPASDCDRVAEQIEDVIGIDASEAIRVSAKTGQGIVETLEAIVHKLPAPKGTQDAPLKAMLVDSWYDSYLGVIVLVRIMDGQLKKGDRIRMMQNGSVHHVDRIGVFRPAMTEIDSLKENLLLLANGRNSAGHALLGGQARGAAYENINGVATFVGTNAVDPLEIGEGQSVTPGLTGPEIFNFSDANGPTDLFQVLGNLAAALAAGGTAAADASSAALGSLDVGLEKVTTAQTVIGSRLNWVDLMDERREKNSERVASEKGDVGGADIALTMTRLQETLTVLEATQASFVKLANLSLFSMIR